MPPAASRDTPTVFVVDDDLSVRESLELLIGFEGWRPELFASARDFLARPRPLTPGCLILDISLPDLNGLDLQRLVADRTEMPVIFITGHGDIPLAVRAMKAGAVEFLTQPFDDLALHPATLMQDAPEIDLEAELKKWLRGRKTAVNSETLLYLVGLEYLRRCDAERKRGQTSRAKRARRKPQCSSI